LKMPHRSIATNATASRHGSSCPSIHACTDAAVRRDLRDVLGERRPRTRAPHLQQDLDLPGVTRVHTTSTVEFDDPN
jgi:hypothetical protein